MDKFPCSLCGSRNWPNPDTSCPLCYGEKNDIEGQDPDWMYDTLTNEDYDDETF